MLKSLLLSLCLLAAAVLPLRASISVIQPHHVLNVPADGIFPATICEFYYTEDGHAYSLVENRLGTLYFYDFDTRVAYYGHCRAVTWPYPHVTYDLGTESEAQPLVQASPPVGFAPAAEGRVVFNASTTPPTEHLVAASATSFSVSFPRQAGGRYSVETSVNGRAWSSVGHEWFVPARRSGLRTVTIPLNAAVKYYRVRRVS